MVGFYTFFVETDMWKFFKRHSHNVEVNFVIFEEFLAKTL